MDSINFRTIKNRWVSLDADDRTSLKLVGSALITAIAFAAIALTLHFSLQSCPIAGWTMDALLMVTALPVGLSAVTGQLLAAFFKHKSKTIDQIVKNKQEKEIKRQLQDPNSAINQSIRTWCENTKEPLDKVAQDVRAQIEENGDDLISILRKIKGGTLSIETYSEEEKALLFKAPILHPLAHEERQLCEEFGINPDECWMLS